MRAIDGSTARTARRLVAALWIAPLALVLSCADMPDAPKVLVHATGTVLDNDGQGMPSVAVYFLNLDARVNSFMFDPTRIPPGEEPSYRGVSRWDGTYDVTLPEGTYIVVAFPPYSSGYAPVVVRSVRLEEGSARWDYRFSWPTVTVRTLLPGGATIPNSRVTLEPRSGPDDPFVPYYMVEARQVGDVLEAVVPPGSYRLYVVPGGYASGYLDTQLDLVVQADTTVDVTEDGALVTARVRGQSATPMVGASVIARSGPRSATAITDGDGMAEFHLPAGSYGWYVYPPVSYIAPREFPPLSIAGGETVELDMAGTEWTGTVRRTGDGAPVVDAEIHTQEVAPFGYGAGAYVQTDASGAFRLIVRTGRAHDIHVHAAQTYSELKVFPNVYAGADSTFDLYVDLPNP